ncbi:MAG: TadE family type IV pilus minor pilin [Microcella sp.]|uniref:TadE family type IV pilus minor pilin n=1 Tax=Microcella sp. TaxID=1913979 RepID=UPI00331577F3
MRDDRGAVTAEVAVALPVVALVLVACLGGLLAATELVRLQSAAAETARLLGRGEQLGQPYVQQAVPGATMAVTRRSGLVCVEARSTPRVLGVPIEISASSCALDGGW